MEDPALLIQEELQFESLIRGLLEAQYGICDDFIDEPMLIALRERLWRYRDLGEMAPAGVGRNFDFKKNALVRGDGIKWIEGSSGILCEMLFLQKMQHFMEYLNKTCYTGLSTFEFHYACYEPGSFYKRHLDQFKSNKGRKYSIILYLNDDWQMSDGGNLTLYLAENKLREIYPVGGRLVFFKSDELEHEVHPSFNRNRLSIAGWLKAIG